MLNQFLSCLTQQCAVAPFPDAVSRFRILSFVQICPYVLQNPPLHLFHILRLFLTGCQHSVGQI